MASFDFKVSFESNESSARCGTVNSRGNALETPCVFIDTQYGLPTFLSMQQLKKANLPPHGFHIDLGNIFDLTSTRKIRSSYDQKSKKQKKTNKKNQQKRKDEKEEINKEDYTKTSVLNKFYDASKKNSIHSMLGLDDYLLLIDYKNCIHRQPQNGTDKFVVLSTEHGNQRLCVTEYMQHAKSVNCDFCVIASENIASSNHSKSRCQKNVNRTMKLFEDSLNGMDKVQSKQCLVGVIEGGNDCMQRIKCLERMSDKFASFAIENYAFMIGGFGFGESEKQKNEILTAVMKALNESKMNKDKLRMIDGLNTLNDVICAIWNGVDLIISSYPTKLTMNGMAMVHSICPNEKNEQSVDCINVADICYATDASPILEGCECFCCQNHSKGYIRHLFNVHEMNSQILLQMHNLYRFLKFVENIKEYMRKGKLSEFCEWWIRYQMNFKK